MRLLQVTTIPETIEAFLLPFATHFRSLGWVVDGAARGASSNVACTRSFDAVHNVGWSRNPLHLANIAAASEMRALLTRERYDLVHVHTPVASFVTRLAASRTRPRPAVVYTAHGFHFHAGGNPVLNLAYSTLERIAGPWTDELVVINSDDHAAALERHLVPPDHLSLVPGIGIDLGEFVAAAAAAPPAEEVLRAIGVPGGTKVVLMVAEFTPNKRQSDALEALSRLDDTSAHLVLVGIGPTTQTIKARASALGLANRVHFLGYRRDVPQLMTVADALILLSEREGLPRSVMEAMAVGVPVIGTDIRGVRDLLGAAAGVLVPVADVRAMALALNETLRAGPEVAQRVATAKGRLDAYSLGNVLAGYEAIYARALGSKRA